MKKLITFLVRSYTLYFPLRLGKFPVLLFFEKVGIFKNQQKEGILGDHTKVMLDLNDWVQKLIYFFRIYEFEKHETNTWLSLLRPKQTILDIGANIGYYSLLAADKYSDVLIYSFEPAPLTFKSLTTNINLNDYNFIKTFNLGVSDNMGTFDLYLAENKNSGMNSMAIPTGYSGKKISIQTVSIDDFKKDQNIKKVDLVKIDVEGNELNVLKGMRNTIKEDMPIFCIEIMDENLRKFGHSSEDVFKLFNDNDYLCFECTKKGKHKQVLSPKDIGLAFFVPMNSESIHEFLN